MRKTILYAGLLLVSLSLFNSSCKKDQSQDKENGHLKQTKTFPSDVVTQWLNMQLEMLRVPLATGAGSQAAERCQAYCGIALYESVVPGMPGYQSLYSQLTDFPKMPDSEPGKAYHWAASANAALATMNKSLFPAASDANKTNMTNLENSFNEQFASEVDASTLERSITFGKEIASRVFAWAATDGSANQNPPYVAPPPTADMPWLWVPTAPPPAAAVNAYAFQRRLLVPDVADGTDLEPPPTYSTEPASSFYAMVKDVYVKSLVLTDEQKSMAVYHRDAPGYPGGGHFVAILSQVISKAGVKLDMAALAYAKVGLAQHDATIVCFIDKYNFNLVRPVTYIRNIIDPNWNTFIPTPNHPEFPSGHATINSSVMNMLTNVFGDNFQITLHTYDYLNLPARSYNSFEEMSIEMANSRVYGGIHYQATCDKSRVQGKQVAQNILNTINFKKGN